MVPQKRFADADVQNCQWCDDMSKGIPMPETARAALLKSHLGVPMSEASRVALLKANTGRPCSVACREGTRKANTGRYRSPETLERMSIAQRGKRAGPLSGAWKGGVTPKNHLLRNSFEYMAWRKGVFERDGYICSICAKHGGDLEAHHINNFAEHGDKIFDIENGVTMCVPCHKRFHLIFGEQHNTLQELQTFVMVQGA
jgi:hypothetical protein